MSKWNWYHVFTYGDLSSKNTSTAYISGKSHLFQITKVEEHSRNVYHVPGTTLKYFAYSGTPYSLSLDPTD